MNIGENITKLRKLKKLTQEDLANSIHVSPKTISSWEKGRNLPNIEMLIQLADIFETDINSILGLQHENSQEIQKAYQKKSLKKFLLIVISLILIFLFFINIQEIGIASLIAKYYSNNEVLTLNDFLEAKDFMYENSQIYIKFIIIAGIFYLLYKKKLSYILITLSGLGLVLSVETIINLIGTDYINFIEYFRYNIEIFIILIMSITGLTCGIELFKQQKRTNK